MQSADKKHSVTCKCGNIIYVFKSRLNRKKYCSKSCFYKYRERPSGLKYEIKKENKTWFKKGGSPWNKGVFLNEKANNWKGEDVGYEALHEWVGKRLGKPKMCDKCKTTNKKIYHWANKSGEYKRDLRDWIRLCVKCHFRYDYENFGARKSFYE